MRKLLAILLLLCSPVFASDRPSVFRVTSVDSPKTSSLGTGTCVATAGKQSLVVTAWHVVRDGHSFKVGQYPAKVVATDRTWDLAALVVDELLPVTVIARVRPEVGAKLTYCGFGSGDYLEGTGEVNAMSFAPNTGISEKDIIAISIQARSGDSGGPMLGEDGKLYAVLFGTDAKIGAHGSHCVRVRWFIEKIEGYPLLKRDALNPIILFDPLDFHKR